MLINAAVKNINHAEVQANDDIYKRFEMVIGSCDYIHRLSKPEFIKKLFNDAFKLVPEAEKGSFYELVEERFVPICSKGYDESLLSKLSFNVDETFIDYESSTNLEVEAKQIYIKSRDDSRFDSETIEVFKALGTYENFTSLYSPVKADGINVGIICLENFSNTIFSSLSVQTLKFYSQLMSSYFTMKHHQDRLDQQHLETISALVSSIEVNDSYTEGHGKRVSYYAKQLGSVLGLSSETISDLETAGLLHDIGKLGIPTDILNKPGKLNDEEYAIVRKHPENTSKILEKVNGLHKVREYAYCHHECFDGSGYPRGIQGSEISYESQIISVADAFDAMTSNRAYRKALSVEEASEIILHQSGKQFQPELAKIAAKILPIVHQKMNLFQDYDGTSSLGQYKSVDSSSLFKALLKSGQRRVGLQTIKNKSTEGYHGEKQQQ